MEDKQDLLLSSLKKFYSDSDNLNILTSIIHQRTTVSLRILDWFVTNYAKKYNLIYNNCNIYLSYKNQLKAYSKKQFDPFCRRTRIFYNTQTGEGVSMDAADMETYNIRDDGIVTTVGQLNFFRWAISNGIIEYAFNNVEHIENDMFNTVDSRNKSKVSFEPKKRKELSRSGIKGVSRIPIQVVIKFG